MARITFRLDDALYERLLEQCRVTELTPSAYLRDMFVRDVGGDPGGLHARFDDLHATMIQTLAILAASVGRSAPDSLEQGLVEARRLLRERGLLDPEQDRS